MNLFEEVWCGLRRNRRKFETLIFLLEVEEAAQHIRKLPLSLFPFHWKKTRDRDSKIPALIR